MTAPAQVTSDTDFTAITARITAIQQLIATVTGTPTSTSAAKFASVLSASSSSSASDTAATAASSSATGADSSSAATQSTGSAVTGAQVVADAKKYLGVPYVWGSETDSGLDCSGLVQKTYKDLGITVPRVAADQQKVGTPVASLADAQPGDLLFFGQPAYHVAIYLGNNQLIESPEPGKTVHITSVYKTPSSISRIVSGSGATATSATTTASATGGLSAATLQAEGIKSQVAAYADQFAAAEKANGLPAGMLAAVCQQESGGNASAVSAAGAKGLMQIMPATAAGMGINPLDPSAAITAAGTILGRNLKAFGSVSLALAAYNAGGGAVSKYGGIPPYTETQNYVRRITATMSGLK